MKAPRLPTRQRGVALLIALILVALATILATKLSFDGYIERQRTVGVLAAEQALHFSFAAEALAADGLAQMNATMVTLADAWAQPVPPFPITPQSDPEGEPIGTLQGQLEDMQGRFNLNSLNKSTQGAANGAISQPDPYPLAVFERLLVAVGIEPKWAPMVRDWIDSDSTVTQNGAEDSIYTQQNPPYRTGNFPMLSTSELMNLPGFGADRFRKIAPYVTVLPNANATINYCTAPLPVLESLGDNMRGQLGTPEVLATERKRAGCFPDQKTLQNLMSKDYSAAAASLGTGSNYFRITTVVSLGTSEFTLYSLLQRSGSGGKFVPILRSFGTP